jgi:hypothetical protein
MISASRADIVSSFTVVKGSMIEETYAVFATIWNACVLIISSEPVA